jgi:hypothetical protein
MSEEKRAVPLNQNGPAELPGHHGTQDDNDGSDEPVPGNLQNTPADGD